MTISAKIVIALLCLCYIIPLLGIIRHRGNENGKLLVLLQMDKKSPSLSEAKQKLEHYCAYQERCHQEVASKLYALGLNSNDSDEVIVHLINQNFLNETRFAATFARGKHRIKSWGRNRIVNELKSRHISSYNIKTALQEISPDEYSETFDKTAVRHWESLREGDTIKKRKKFCDYLLRKGFESDLVYEKVKEFEKTAS